MTTDIAHARNELLERAHVHIVACLDKGEIDVPLLPDVSLRVLELCSRPDAEASEIAKILHRDAMLASHVLRVANSAQLGSRVVIASLQQAISRLGLRTIAEIALAVSLQGRVFDPRRHPEFFARLWRRSVTTALLAKTVARQVRGNVENAFLSALLHDIGRPIVVDMAYWVEDRSPGIFEVEELVALTDIYYLRAGQRLLDVWQLPDAIRAGVVTSEFVLANGDVTGAVVWFASQLADLALGEVWTTTEEDVRRSPLLPLLELYPDDLDEIIAGFPRVREQAEVYA